MVVNVELIVTIDAFIDSIDEFVFDKLLDKLVMDKFMFVMVDDIKLTEENKFVMDALM